MMISYKEYEAEFRKQLGAYTSVPDEYTNQLIEKGCVRAQFEDDRAIAKMENHAQLNPSGFADCCYMLYPDFPDTWEEYIEKSFS